MHMNWKQLSYLLRISGGYLELGYCLYLIDNTNKKCRELLYDRDRNLDQFIFNVEKSILLNDLYYSYKYEIQIMAKHRKIFPHIKFEFIEMNNKIYIIKSNICTDCDFNLFLRKLKELLIRIYPVGRHYMDQPLYGDNLKIKKNQ